MNCPYCEDKMIKAGKNQLMCENPECEKFNKRIPKRAVEKISKKLLKMKDN